jgi:hypothetical protein
MVLIVATLALVALMLLARHFVPVLRDEEGHRVLSPVGVRTIDRKEERDPSRR